MTGNYFYKDRAGGQNGPVSLEELQTIARSGRLAPDCLVWPGGGEPLPAGKTPGLSEIFGGGSMPATAAGQGRLIGDVPGWGLIWRAYVLIFGLLSVVFAPLAGRWYYRFLASHVSLPNGRRIFLDSPLSSCWWMFLAMAVLVWAPLAALFALAGDFGAPPHADAEAVKALNLQLLPLRLATNFGMLILSYFVVRWFARSLRSEDGALDIAFTGGFWAFFGWNLLIALSFVTIIGWAWALKGMMSWMCRRTEGSHAFSFVASGWEILWRTLVLVLGPAALLGVFIGLAAGLGKAAGDVASGIPGLVGLVLFIAALAQAVGWFVNWFVSQIIATPAAASDAQAQKTAA